MAATVLIRRWASTFATTSITSTASNFTVTTAAANPYGAGDVIVIAGATPSAYNGTWTIASITSSTVFVVTSAINPGTATVQGTTTRLSDITSINTRANAEDAHSTAGTANSVLIPASGTNYSFWVATRLDVTAITAGTVNNIKWYTDGTNSFGTGVTCNGNTATSYIQATGTTGTTGTQLTVGNYSTITTPVDVFSFTSGAPKAVTGTTSAVSNSFADLFVYQIAVGTTAASGATPAETFTYQYDDTSA